MPGSSRGTDDTSNGLPRLLFPERRLSPLRSIVLRLLVALGALVVTTVIVYVERPCYQDQGQIGALTWIDALYYAAVSLSTTGYGDITPICESSRLVNVFVITPLRFLFLIVLVGTTIEVLTRRTREQWRRQRWRKSVNDHTIIVGFGVKGRAAAEGLIESGTPASQIVIVSNDRANLDDAAKRGFTAVDGDARREATLTDAEIQRAANVIVAVAEDDTTILITLTARKLNSTARIVAAVREAENADMVRQSGATSIIPTAESAGRLMSMTLVSPTAGSIIEDLLDSRDGLQVTERGVAPDEIGLSPADLDARDEIVLAVVRDGVTHRFDTEAVTALEPGDRLVLIRHHGPQT